MAAGGDDEHKLSALDVNTGSEIFGTLENLTMKTWKQQEEVELASAAARLRIINNEIWLCHHCGITVYDSNLKEKRSIRLNDTGGCRDVAVMQGELIVACENGLYSLDLQGKMKTEIDSGDFYGVVISSSVIYASHYQSGTIRTYSNINGSWKRQGLVIECAEEDTIVTIDIANHQIYACSVEWDKINVYSMEGKLQHSHGCEGSGPAGELASPFLGCVDTRGAALVADCNNGRLQLMKSDKTWEVVTMETNVKDPGSAVYHEEKLYVASAFDKLYIFF